MIELMITVAVLGVLLTLAVPNFTGMLKNNRMTTKTNDLVMAFNIARQAAIARGTNVFVCKTDNPDAAAPTCKDGTPYTSWLTGVLVYAKQPGATFADTFNGREFDRADGDELIFQTSLGANATYSVDVAGSAESMIGFSSDGLRYGELSGGAIGICDERTGDVGRTVEVSLVGRVSSKVKTCT